MAPQITDFTIPVVDFSKYLKGSHSERDECIESIMNGFTSSGFLYLINSGISPDQLDSVYAESAKYFALPWDVKSRFPNNSPLVNRGYSGLGVEKVTNVTDAAELAKEKKEFPDIKESLEIGSEPGVEGNYPTKPYVNRWPKELPSLRLVMTKFYKTCEDLHFEVLSAIAEGLGQDKDFFRREIKNGDHNLRLLHYPGVEQEQLGKDKSVRAGAHTDYGTITLLFQDDSGGLQVRYPDGEFHDAKPFPGAIVVNAGDLLQHWTNDVIKSTYHRVVAPTNPSVAINGKYGERYSIAFFAHPDHTRKIAVLPTCYSESRPKKYDDVLPGDWIETRLATTRGTKRELIAT